jgi:hypothetical protein
MRDVFVENFVALSRSIEKSILNSDPDDKDILGENSIEKTNVDRRERSRTKVANRSIASEAGRTFMRCWRVLSEALWYAIAVVTIKSAKKKPVNGHHGVSRDSSDNISSSRTYHRGTLSNTAKQAGLVLVPILLKWPCITAVRQCDVALGWWKVASRERKFLDDCTVSG